MDTNAVRRHVVRFRQARGNLLALVLMTTLNLFLLAFNADFYMVFSATTPLIVFATGQSLAASYQNSAYLIVGGVLAAACIALFFSCWMLSKHRRGAMLWALILFGLDSLLLALVMAGSGFQISFLADILFHVWILYYLISGTVAWTKLRGVDDETYAALAQNREPLRRPLPQNAGAYPAGRPDADGFTESVPLRADAKRGRVIIRADCAGLSILMRRSWGLTELVVNGRVYDEMRGVVEFDYTLFACVGGHRIAGVAQSTILTMFLYVDDVRVAKKFRLI